MLSNISELCNYILSEIRVWDGDKTSWITDSYIPGKENYDADAESRKKQMELKWILNRNVFKFFF